MERKENQQRVNRRGEPLCGRCDNRVAPGISVCGRCAAKELWPEWAAKLGEGDS